VKYESRWSHWPDPTWRLLRITSFVTAALTLIFLAIFLSGVTSWRYPLAVVVVANVIVMFLVVFTSYELRNR
jgi:hypothetical protein